MNEKNNNWEIKTKKPKIGHGPNGPNQTNEQTNERTVGRRINKPYKPSTNRRTTNTQTNNVLLELYKMNFRSVFHSDRLLMTYYCSHSQNKKLVFTIKTVF